MKETRVMQLLVKSAITLVSLIGLCTAYAGEALTVSDGYIRMAPPGVPAAVYFTLTNNSDTAQTVIAFEAKWAAMVMLHESTQHNGMTQMRHLDTLTVAAHAQALLQPGGMHLMLMNVAPLQENEVRELTMRTQDGSVIKLLLPVRRP